MEEEMKIVKAVLNRFGGAGETHKVVGETPVQGKKLTLSEEGRKTLTRILAQQLPPDDLKTTGSRAGFPDEKKPIIDASKFRVNDPNRGMCADMPSGC